jgi:cytochrome c551/c552
VFDWFEREHPTLAGSLSGSGEDDLASWRERLKAVEWDRGVAKRGEAIFRARACETCHTGVKALGPDLSGVTGRFSRDDLVAATLVQDQATFCSRGSGCSHP